MINSNAYGILSKSMNPASFSEFPLVTVEIIRSNSTKAQHSTVVSCSDLDKEAF